MLCNIAAASSVRAKLRDIEVGNIVNTAHLSQLQKQSIAEDALEYAQSAVKAAPRKINFMTGLSFANFGMGGQRAAQKQMV